MMWEGNELRLRVSDSFPCFSAISKHAQLPQKKNA